MPESLPDPIVIPDDPEINVLLTSLLIFFVYTVLSMGAALGLMMSSNTLHPATRVFIYFVVCAVIGYRLLVKHGRYPRPLILAITLLLSIFYMIALGASAVMRTDTVDMSSYLTVAVIQTFVLFVFGYGGFYFAQRIQDHRRRAR